MTRSIILAAASVAALASASPAFAQDAAPVASTISGGRVELLAGWDRVGLDDYNKSGLAYGIGAGYDFAFSPTMSAGIDAEIADSTTEKRVSGVKIKTGRDLYVGGRLSFAAGQRGNVYVKGGYTNARLTIPALDYGKNFGGWRLGVGGQYAISGKAYVGAEYRYSNYKHHFDRNQLVATVGTRF